MNVLADALSRMHGDETISVKKIDVIDNEREARVEWEAEKRGYSVPPENERTTMIEKNHLRGHFGVNKIFRSILELGFWWPKMRRDIADVIHGCTACQRFNLASEGYHPLQSVVA